MTPRALTGRTAVVTGASRGLGRAIACALAEAGANLVLVARNRAALAEVTEAIRDGGGAALSCPADVSREEQVERISHAIEGAPHILVNNAGVTLRKPLPEITLEEWSRVLSSNLTGSFLMCRAMVPRMKEAGFGRIVNLSSVTALTPGPARAAYAASKAGILGLTRALALELAPFGITVNSVSPGPFRTSMNAPLIEDPVLARHFLSRLPVGRWGDPEEVAALIVYLCSDEAGFLTGAELLIDGGWRAH